MKKIERLLNLISALLSTERPLSRHEIRERIPGAYSESDESFRRTFERDKDELRALGLPISLEKILGTDPPLEGYRIHKSDYEADHPSLEGDEIAALHLASNLIRLQGDDIDSTFYKMGGVLKEKPSALSEIPTERLMELCMQALHEHQSIFFKYKNERREVNPYRLVFSGGRWYLIAHDNNREGIRHFRLDRIEGEIELTTQKFEPSDEFSEISEEPPWRFGEEENLVELKINKSHVSWALEIIGQKSAYEELSDGSIILYEVVRDWQIFRSFVFSFLDAAELLNPPECREALIEWLELIK